MSRRRGRGRRAARNKALAIGSVGLALLLALGFGAMLLAGRSIQPELDAATLCPSEEHIREEHLVLLDATDPWNPLQRRVIEQTFRDLQEELPRFARIYLHTIERSGAILPQPLVLLCHPGRPEDLEGMTMLGKATDDILANPRMMRERWTEGFVNRLDSVFAAQADLPSAAQSPIMETLRGAAVEAFGRGNAESKPPRHVHIFSDMLQNSTAYSHYRAAAWDPEHAVQLADPAETGTRSLEGARVNVYLLDRPALERNPEWSRVALVRFWDRYFSAQGATLIRVERVEG